MKRICFGLFLTGWCVTSLAQNRIVKTLTDTITIEKRKGIVTYVRPVASINTYYRLYIGANYNIVHKSSGEKSYSAKHTLGLNYSISENSFSPYYSANFPKALADWNLSFLAGYDQSRRLNFFGPGNESQQLTSDREFYRFRTQNQYARMSIDKFFASHHHVDVSLLYNAIKVKDREDHFLSTSKDNINPSLLDWQYYLSPQLTYSYLHLNEQLIPTKSFDITTTLSYNGNLNRSESSFMRLTTDMNLYLPLPKPFSFLVHVGGATLTGDPDFYQLNSIGGSTTLRGYDRFRFYGKTAFYNQNELRWIPYVKTSFYKGHLGLLALYDQGRVWQPGETSNKMHSAYGAGIIVSPFNKAVITAAYAISNEEHRIHLRVGKLF